MMIIWRFSISIAVIAASLTSAPILASAQETAIQPATDTLTIWAVRGKDTVAAGHVIDRIAIVGPEGERRFVRTYITLSTLLPTRVDTMVDMVNGLVPVRAVTVRGDSSYVLEFRNDTLKGEFLTPFGRRQRVDWRLPPHVINGSNFDLLIRGSLLGMGDTISTIAVDPDGFFGVRRLIAKVDGQEEIEGKQAWRVISNFPNGMRATFWIDQATRALVQQRLELSSGVELIFNHKQGRGRTQIRRSA